MMECYFYNILCKCSTKIASIFCYFKQLKSFS